jgi:hypothetical protein
VQEWWHLSMLFELRDEGHPLLTCAQSAAVLATGDEALIRDLAARKGLAKVSRSILDAYTLNDAQLTTLQGLLDICDLDAELTLLSQGGRQKTITIARLLKLRRAGGLFPVPDEGSGDPTTAKVTCGLLP